MVKKRERLEIIRDILTAIQKFKNIRHAKLLHSSNLSPQMFKQYIGELLEKGFIKRGETGKIKYFVLDYRGMEFLKEYRNIENVIRNFGL